MKTGQKMFHHNFLSITEEIGKIKPFKIRNGIPVVGFMLTHITLHILVNVIWIAFLGGISVFIGLYICLNLIDFFTFLYFKHPKTQKKLSQVNNFWNTHIHNEVYQHTYTQKIPDSHEVVIIFKTGFSGISLKEIKIITSQSSFSPPSTVIDELNKILITQFGRVKAQLFVFYIFDEIQHFKVPIPSSHQRIKAYARHATLQNGNTGQRNIKLHL
jgi:hypothetical protein